MHMTSINNVKSLSAEKLFALLKTEFADYINGKLGSNLAIEYAHVADIINVSFPEVIEGPALTITVTGEELTVGLMAMETGYNAELLEEHLVGFLTEEAG
jgi:hypothetical protein